MSKRHTVGTQIQSHFARAVHADIQRSTFFRNSTKKTTMNCGELVPVYIDEILPGDTFEMDMKFISRLTTPIFPTMDLLNMEFHALFVPNRIVWDGWEELNAENKTGLWVQQNPPALVPQYNQGTITENSIGDYFGLPVGMNLADYPVSALPFRGLGLIWNDWYRDQNLQAPIPLDKGNTVPTTPHPFAPTATSMLKVNKKHDYFTSCLPAPQKGESSLIPISIGELIPVITGDKRWSLNNPPMTYDSRSTITGSQYMPTLYKNVLSGIEWKNVVNIGAQLSQSLQEQHDVDMVPNNLWADGRGINISGTTISDLRTAFQIQKLFERDARGGTRYVEMLKAHFGVEAQDYRLQRPEFLGSYTAPVGVYQVPQMSETNQTPQGNVSAFSYTNGFSKLFNKTFTEHGYLFIFAIARHPKTYQQGLERFWTRRERFDFYYPALAHISEQPVYKKEIYALSPKEVGDSVFGYNEAWADYKYKPNQVTGGFRSANSKTLDNWHYADKYTSTPFLSDTWIQDNSKENVDRTIAVQSSLHDQILLDIAFLCKATRPMPLHSVPGLVDHF